MCVFLNDLVRLFKFLEAQAGCDGDIPGRGGGQIRGLVLESGSIYSTLCLLKQILVY